MLWANGGWKDFDIILGNGTLSMIEDLPPAAYNKMVCGIWSMPNLSSHFKEIIIPRDGISWCCKGDDLRTYLKDNYNIEAPHVDGGISDKDFYPKRKITKIKNVGLNGVPFVNPGWDEIKRPDWLIKIAEGIDGKPVFINGKGLDEASTMYDDIDMYICTSVNDRGPYGIGEATFCKIPVLSTKTGMGIMFKSIKTFDTPEEAIQIINDFNNNPEKLEAYIEEVYEELHRELNWDHVANSYWRPIFENKLALNKR
jgi:hypothetical protein